MKVERSVKAANGGAEIRKKPKPVGALSTISTRHTTSTSHFTLAIAFHEPSVELDPVPEKFNNMSILGVVNVRMGRRYVTRHAGGACQITAKDLFAYVGDIYNMGLMGAAAGGCESGRPPRRRRRES